MSLVERGPNKRRIKPSANPELIHFFNDSSSDSDFRIEDHYVNSESDSGDSNLSFTNDYGNQEEAKKDDEYDIRYNNGNMTSNSTSVMTPNQDNSTKVNLGEIVDQLRVCSICLGDASDDVNELINCDECGITVHEGCYGVHNSGSVSSSILSCSTEPWFCESCKAGIENPTCELCPNFGGIFKETDCGKWVHLVCVLYIPGITFGEVKSLSKIELFKNAAPQWGRKSCTLCKDSKFSSTGVTISCDAGMCQTSFHVTCAQQEGCLSEVTSPEIDPKDPFYGHCILHADKLLVKKKKRNWEILQLRTKQIQLKREQQSSEKSATWQRNQRCLREMRSNYHQMKKTNKTLKTESSFKSKIPRSITTSASSCRALWSKASLMGINMTSQDGIEKQLKELRDVPKKWDVPPTLSLEFVSYFTDRNLRLTDLKNQLKNSSDQNKKLHNKQKIVEEKYTQDLINNEIQKKKHLQLENIVKAYHNVIKVCNPNASIPDVDKMQNNHNSFSENPNSEPQRVDPNATRKSINGGKELFLSDSQRSSSTVNNDFNCSEDHYKKSGTSKEIINEQHRDRYSSKIKTERDMSLEHKHKRHRDNSASESEPSNNTLNNTLNIINELPIEALKLFIKTFSSASGSKTTSSQLLIGSPASAETPQICTKTKPEKSVTPIRNTLTDLKLTPKCHICKETGTTNTIVQCEDCSNYYHLCCLDPPLKKSPVSCGYSWHCADCDLTDSDY